MAEYPTEFQFDVLLKDGAVVQLRPIRPDDAQREHEFFGRVRPDSAYFRFFGAKSDLSPDDLRYFTNIDYHDRMAFIALEGEDMVAVGRYDVLVGHEASDGGKVAEIAFLVQDDFQGRGIGSRLLQHLTVYARLEGISEFEAYVLSENHGMLRLFRSSGYKLTRQLDQGVYTVEFPIEYSMEAREAEWEHEKRATTASMLPILYPASIAVVGASRDDESIGGRLFRNLLRGFTGPVYPVNPATPVVNGIETHSSVAAIPDPVDLAFIVVPAAAVPATIEECGRKGVRGVVVISAGFGETGDEGTETERRLVATARRYGMRMVGPNCMGVVNTDTKVSMDGQFGPVFPPIGNVAMASQSGALGLAILEQAVELDIGISTFVSLGNKADVSANDLLLYWEEDPGTDVILLYMESFGNARRFGRLARRVSRTKPIVAVKSGRSASGSAAAASHTGSLASLDVAVDALFKKSGVIRTETLDELFAVTSLLSKQALPAGRRVAVLSNAGGPAILAADALEAHNLALPQLSAGLRAKLSDHLLSTASTRNPVDMVAAAGPTEYRLCLGHLLDSDEIDAVIIIHIPTTPGGSEAVAAAVNRAVEQHPNSTKTLLAVYMGVRSRVGTPDGTRDLPVYRYPETAAKALAAAVSYGEWRARPEGEYPRATDIDIVDAQTTIRHALGRVGADGGWLTGDEITRLFSAHGIGIVASRIVATEEEAVAAAADIGGPVALKVVSPSTVHKSDVGGVALDVVGTEAVAAAFRRVTGVADDVEGAVVQEYVAGGHEVIVGMTEDPLFGPLIVFGLGGIFVELMQDLTFRINPLSDVDAAEMITEVKASQLLSGYRGGDAGDIDAIHDLLLRVSTLVEEHPEIAEMDLNPVKVLPPGRGLRVVDARVRVRPIRGAFLPSRKDVPGRML